MPNCNKLYTAAAPINPSDVKNVEGKMEHTTLPRVPGRDCAGTVIRGPADWIGAEV
jgi:NADPH:quinone reductase-like Zn-dependent oxidoreductase